MAKSGCVAVATAGKGKPNNIINIPAVTLERERMLAWLTEWEKQVPATGKAEMVKAKDTTVGAP